MDVTAKKNMFEEFEALSESQWKEKMASELKGRPIEDLTWQVEGLNILPFYRNNAEKKYQESHAILSYLRTGLREGWQIRQSFNLHRDESNDQLLESLQNGCSSVNLIGQPQNLSRKLTGVFPQMVPIYFHSKNLMDYIGWAKTQSIDIKQLQGGLNDDLLAGFEKNEKTDLNWIDQFQAHSKIFESNPVFKTLKVNSSYFESCGASIVQQLAYALAFGNEYLEQLSDDYSIDDLSARIYFEMSIGNSFFLEIAKLRALRILWTKIIQAYQPKHTCSGHTYIVGKTSELLLGINDSETNLIRNSQAAMAAAIGSCNEIEVLSHDGKMTNNALRLSRNIQNLMKEESYLDKVCDISMGSHYIDNLTFELVEAAWDEFMKIQLNGGFFKNLDNGNIQDKIVISAEKKVKCLNDGSQAMIGENKYTKANQSKVVWFIEKGQFQFPKISCNG